MSKHFVQSSTLRSAVLAGYQAYARAQFWRTGPRIFVNSIPKAGTHLLTAELERFPELQNSRLHLEIARIKVPGQRTPEGHPVIDHAKVARAVSQVRKGQFFSAHVFWTQELEDLVTANGSKMVFMVRDPRDVLLSRLHYVLRLRRHWLHSYLTTQFDNAADRLRVLINGNAEPLVLSLRTTLEGYRPWLQRPNVLTVRFEDLVGARGGGSAEAKLAALEAIAGHCGLAPAHLQELAASSSGATATLRKGRIGGWREEMPAEIPPRDRGRLRRSAGGLWLSGGLSCPPARPDRPAVQAGATRASMRSACVAFFELAIHRGPWRRPKIAARGLHDEQRRSHPRSGKAEIRFAAIGLRGATSGAIAAAFIVIPVILLGVLLDNQGLLYCGLCFLAFLIPLYVGLQRGADFDPFEPINLVAFAVLFGSSLRSIWLLSSDSSRVDFIMMGTTFNGVLDNMPLILLSLLSFTIGYALFPLRMKLEKVAFFRDYQLGRQRFWIAIAIAGGISMIGIPWMIIEYGISFDAGILAASKKRVVAYVNDAGEIVYGRGFQRFLAFGAMHGVNLIVAAILARLLRPSVGVIAIAAGLAAMAIITPFLTSSRSSIVLILLNIFIFGYYYKRVSLRTLLVVFGASLFVLSALGALRQQNQTGAASEDMTAVDRILGSGNSLDFVRTSAIIDRVPQYTPHLRGETYVAVFATRFRVRSGRTSRGSTWAASSNARSSAFPARVAGRRE